MRPVWKSNPSVPYNQQVGFYTCVEGWGLYRIRIAVRSCYRLYINGKMKAHGPARTAKGYCRVDEISFRCTGSADIAIEVMAYDQPVKYSNDCR